MPRYEIVAHVTREFDCETAEALAAALDDTVPWRFQVVQDWFTPPNAAGAVGATTSPPRMPIGPSRP